MKRSVLCFLVILGLAVVSSSAAMAISSDIVISQVQAGDIGAPTQEYIALYNNSDHPVDVTGWCLSSKNTLLFACLSAKEANIRLLLPGKKSLTIASDTFTASRTGYVPDSIFLTTNKVSGSVVAGGDSLKLLNAKDEVIDSVEWTSSIEAGTILQRQTSPDGLQLIDTDASSDFSKLKTWTIATSGLYEEVTEIDLCSNLPDAQITMPPDMVYNDAGECVVRVLDKCQNISGIQTDIPAGYGLDEQGVCVVDMCTNLAGLQVTIPDDYTDQSENRNCEIKPHARLQITELLPNPSGSDTGREFVEIYNPNDSRVMLSAYYVRIGLNGEKTYNFPTGAFIEPHAYYVLTNADIPYTLVNTGSYLQLIDDRSQVIDEVPVYLNAIENYAWALVDEEWQFTDQPTPGQANVGMIAKAPTLIASAAPSTASLTPCDEGKERNPETNRCRAVVTISSTLAPCASDEYRSGETNRCRKIAKVTSSLTPCQAGQSRNPETNRCRSVGVETTTQQVPCKEGQERNPTTNRCRTVQAAATIPAAAFAVEPIAQSANAFVGWWALGGVGSLAVGYGIWEWHRELAGAFRRALGFIVGHK